MASILIVVNSVELSHLYVQLFASYHHKVTVIFSAQNIRDVIAGLNPDLVLLDVFLTDDIARAICKEIKQTNNSVPIILLSSVASLKETRIICGADDYVEKPFDVKYLLDKTNEWIKKHRLSTDAK